LRFPLLKVLLVEVPLLEGLLLEVLRLERLRDDAPALLLLCAPAPRREVERRFPPPPDCFFAEALRERFDCGEVEALRCPDCDRDDRAPVDFDDVRARDPELRGPEPLAELRRDDELPDEDADLRAPPRAEDLDWIANPNCVISILAIPPFPVTPVY